MKRVVGGALILVSAGLGYYIYKNRAQFFGAMPTLGNWPLEQRIQAAKPLAVIGNTERVIEEVVLSSGMTARQAQAMSNAIRAKQTPTKILRYDNQLGLPS